MSLDAMHWVWNHSQTRGNARLALLFVADQVRTPACEVRVSVADLMCALNASRNTAREAIRAAEETGELETIEPASGRRAALYRLPKAVGHVQPSSRRGSELDPLENRRGSELDPLRPGPSPRRGSELDPLENRRGSTFDRRGSELDPPYPHPTTNQQAGTGAGEASSDQTDVFTVCGPLIQAMTDAGITVSWDMSTEQWMETVRVVQRAGVDAMVEFALKTMPTAKTPVRFAKFFLAAGWRGLPPASARQPSQARMPRSLPPHCGECDPDTRLRSGETPDGFRVVAPCPDCHPNREGAAA